MSKNMNKALQVAEWVIGQAVVGVRPLSSAKELAAEYLADPSYRDNHERVGSLINWETSKNFTSGFLTGVGGAITLPAAVPTALAASWVLQARMAGAVAAIYGHDLRSDRVRTLVLLSIVGDSAKEALKGAGIQIGTRLSERVLQQIPGRMLVEINRAVGFRLLTKAGEAGLVNLAKLIPLVGGLVGGTFDAVSCQVVGRSAKQAFAP